MHSRDEGTPAPEVVNTAEAMDHYFLDKAAMGIIWAFEAHSSNNLEDRKPHFGEAYRVIGGPLPYEVQETQRFWTAYAGTFMEVLMPELRNIAREHRTRIYVEPFAYADDLPVPPLHCLQGLHGAIFWPLEVVEKLEAQGIWRFKEDITILNDTLLYLKFTVRRSGAGMVPGAWVGQ